MGYLGIADVAPNYLNTKLMFIRLYKHFSTFRAAINIDTYYIMINNANILLAIIPLAKSIYLNQPKYKTCTRLRANRSNCNNKTTC